MRERSEGNRVTGSAVEEFRAVLEGELVGAWAVSEEVREALVRHFVLLERWNRRLNLCGVGEAAELARLHYCESVAVARLLPEGGLSVLDVGSGAGFPGFVLSVVRPECSVRLLERDRRKCVFLREAALGVGNCEVVCGELERTEWRGAWVVCRAVNPELVAREAGRVGKRLGLVVSGKSAGVLKGRVSEWQWAEPVALPWGRDRVLLMGRWTRSPG